jgi:hypothetical protein
VGVEDAGAVTGSPVLEATAELLSLVVRTPLFAAPLLAATLSVAPLFVVMPLAAPIFPVPLWPALLFAALIAQPREPQRRP